MKIGFISTYFYPVLGGAESNCFYLAKELAKKHEVHVFTSNDGSFPAEEVIENIQVHRCKTTFRKGYYAAFYPSLLKKVVQQELDILHVHSFGFLWHDVCVVLKKLFSPKTKLVITPHGPFMALKKYALWKIIIKKIVNVIEFIPNGMYDRVIQVNPFQKERLPKFGFKKSKIIFLPNGIPANFLKKAKPLKNLKGHFVISYVGRVQKYKGLDQVIRVLPFLKEKRKEVLFVIAGDPEEMNSLASLAKELGVGKQVLFLGKIPEEEKRQLLAASKIFVFPSKWEAFGIAMLEAMAQGVVIISSKTEGGRFLIKEENGVLFESGDLNDLKKAFGIIHNQKKMKQISVNNRKKAGEFTWERIGGKLEEVYQDIK